MIMKDYLDMKNLLDKVEKIKVRDKVRDHITLDEYKQIIKYLKKQKDYRGLALFSLFYSSGIRVGEIHRLNIEDLDLEDLSFNTVGKGEQGRSCLFLEEARDCIVQYLETRDDDLLWLFNSRENNRWSVSAIQKFVKTTVQKTGIKKNIHPHLLRHGNAMLLLDNGLPLDEIQRVLGYKSVSTTQIYARTSMQKVKRNVNNIYKKVL